MVEYTMSNAPVNSRKRRCLLTIYRDPVKICSYLQNWIREQFSRTKAAGAVLGISGGIDSAVLAGLLARTLGPDKVLGVIMPCRSQQMDEDYARLLAAYLGIKTYKVDLSDVFDSVSAAISAEGLKLDALPSANIKPRLRMVTLYAIAQQNGCLVCGGGNKDEIMYGYFTKHGDSGVDLLPLADLLKGEVRALAVYLGIPKEIIDRPPTAGLWAGQTDESEMGLTYEELDSYLAAGIASEKVKSKIDDAIARSEHKRKFPLAAVLPENL
jgi:NAD+ synthase